MRSCPSMTRALALGTSLCVLAACQRDLPISPPVHSAPLPQRVAIPDADPVMGVLSALAQHVVLALRDSSTRMDVMRAMKGNNPTLLGLDLRSCSTDLVVQRIFAMGERRGGSAATTMCQLASSHVGLVLYMDRDRLRAWDGLTIPIVTAIERPNETLPPTFHGYRSASRVIDLSRDSTAGGPLLVVLPLIHQNGYAQRANDSPSLGIPIGKQRATGVPAHTHSGGHP